MQTAKVSCLRDFHTLACFQILFSRRTSFNDCSTRFTANSLKPWTALPGALFAKYPTKSAQSRRERAISQLTRHGRKSASLERVRKRGDGTSTVCIQLPAGVRLAAKRPEQIDASHFLFELLTTSPSLALSAPSIIL